MRFIPIYSKDAPIGLRVVIDGDGYFFGRWQVSEQRTDGTVLRQWSGNKLYRPD